jgi:hypothetical protein
MININNKESIFSSFNDDFLDEVVKNVNDGENPLRLRYLNSEVQDNLFDKNIINERILSREEYIKSYYGDFLEYRLSELELSKLNECRVYFNKTIDRIFLTPQSSRVLDSYFNTLVTFWFFILTKQFNIKSIFFGSSPHFPWDITLFFVAKLLRIKTFILRRTLIEDCVIFDIDFRYSHSKPIKFEPSFEGLVEINKLLKTYEKESYWINWSKSMIAKSVSSNSKSRLSFFLKYFRKINQSIKHMNFELRTSKDTYFSLSKLNYLKFFYKRFLQQRKLLQFWESHSNPLDNFKDKHSVYFPLHFQPERSTDPESGSYTQQIMVVKLLLSLLPNEWVILVKEHPRQNSTGYPNFRRFHFRSISEYKELFSLKRVVPISMNVSSDSIIPNVNLTASCTGSIIWEGMLKGKPSISFGNHWHNSCNSSPHINDILTGKVSLEDLLKKTKDDVKKDLEGFITNNQHSFVNSSNSSQFASKSNQKRKLLIKNLKDAIVILQNSQ